MGMLTIDFPHALSKEDARARLHLFDEYLKNRHGIQTTWSSDDSASFRGKYMVVSFEGQFTIEDKMVRCTAKDPGMLWRNKAKSYIEGKFKTYLDPTTPIDKLPRG